MVTMAGKQKDLIDALNSLIELDFDAVQAYEAAIERLESKKSQNKLGAFCEDHRRHTVELSEEVRKLGKQPKDKADIKAVLAKGKVVLAGLIGDRAILTAMKTNEDDTNAAYEYAVSRQDTSADLRAILERNLADERRHRAWIEAELERGSERQPHA
jgi:uncharacterized protein (TIGR02284 family)